MAKTVKTSKSIPKNNKNAVANPTGFSLRTEFWMLAICLLLTFFVYIPSFQADYVNWDDGDYVYDNTDIRSFSNLKAILTKPVQGNYHPVTMLSLALNYAISGKNPSSFHILNVLLHLFNVVLTFYFILRLTKGKKWIAFITALLFGIHPVHVESVAWITERKDVLYAFFFLLGLNYYVKYVFNQDKKAYFYTLLFFALSLLSKPAAVVFPLVLLAIDYYVSRWKDWKVLMEKIPHFLMALGMGLLTYWAQSKQGSIADVFSFTTKVLFAFYGLMMYLVKLFVPLKLVPFYPFPAINAALGWEYYLAPVVILLLIGGVIYSMKRTNILAFGMGFYLINLLLVLQVVTVGSAVMADRYTYIPYIGIFFIIASGFDYWIITNNAKVPASGIGLLAIVALLFTYLGNQQTKIWTNGETLWDHTIKNHPSATAYENRALLYKEKKNTEKALEYYSEAIKINVEYHEAYSNRGNIYFDQNRNEEAMADYNKCLEINPDYNVALDNRGALYARLNQFDKALEDLNRAISIKPDYEMPYFNRAITYMEMKQYEPAIQDFMKYLRLKPGNGDVMNSIGVCYQGMQNQPEAIKWFNQALAAKEHGVFYFNRSISYMNSGDKTKALQDALKAKAMGVKVEDTYLNQLNSSN